MADKKVPTPKSKSKAFAEYRKKHGYSHKADPKHPMNAERTGPLRKAGGGKLKMVEKGGKKVPFYAADGVGKMAKGGKMKESDDLMYKITGLKDPRGYKKEGPAPKKPAIKKASGGPVKVKSGDTLSQIAKSKGVTLKALLAANPNIKNANQIRVGQSIKIPGAAAGAGAKSSNPYKGMTKTQMNMMDVKNKDRKKQTAATRSMQVQGKYGASPTSPSSESKKKIEDRSGFEAMRKRARKLKAQKQAAPKKSRPAIPSNDIAAKKGGQMKKYASGGMVRGAGAATKGKRFGRCG